MRCAKCGTEMTALNSYRCPECAKMTCLEHRMPDRHNCGSSESGGVDVKSMLGIEEARAPKAPEQAQRAPAEPQKFERMQPAQEKKKRFGIF